MYSEAIVGRLLGAATKFTLENDRGHYVPFFQIVEEFCRRDCVCSGRVGMLLSARKHEQTLDSFYWEIYANNTFETAKKLADALAAVKSNHIPVDTLSMQTNLKNREFTIYLMARPIVKVYAVGNFRGKDLVDVMNPGRVQSVFSPEPIRVVPDYIHLAMIYRDLYTPAKVSLWAALLELEPLLWENLAAGSRQAPAVGAREDSGEICGGAQDEHQMLKFVREFLREEQNIVVGEYAASLLCGKTPPASARLQIISSMNIDEIARVFSARGNVVKINYPTNTFGDFQLTKHSLYLDNRNYRKLLLEVYNSSTYEMVPRRIIGGMRVGNPLVVLRFLFIEQWIVRQIAAAGVAIHFDSQPIHETRRVLYEDLEAAFQLDGYDGVYTREDVAKKKMIKELGERFPTYYPGKKKE
jgi:hypothetical protein